MNTRLTLREAYETHYDKSELTDATLKSYQQDLRRWELHTSNPDVRDITNETLAQFRKNCIEFGYAPASINGIYSRVRAVLRRLGPSERGNPFGLGIIDGFPAMKLLKVVKTRPYSIPLEDLSRFYVYTARAEFPRCGIPPATWWRALIVTAYCTALRRGDLLRLLWSQLDLSAMTMDFTARKTGKADLWPLHPVAGSHLAMIMPETDRCRVFRGMFSGGSGSFYKAFRKLQREAGIERLFSLHDLRRTAGSQIERVAPGMGPELLQHTPRSVSDVSYINKFDALRESFAKFPIPDGWKAGPKVAARQAEKVRENRVEMNRADFEVPTGPVAEDWKFRDSQFWLRGKWYRLPSKRRWIILRELATSPEPVTASQLLDSLGRYAFTCKTDHVRRLHTVISALRMRLRACLGLEESHDPIPCVSIGNGGAWTIWLPPVR